MPTCARSSNISRSVRVQRSLPKMRTTPLSGTNRPLASFIKTLLPTPAGPRTTRVSPRSTAKLTPRSTSFSSKRRQTSSNCTTGTLGGSVSTRLGCCWESSVVASAKRASLTSEDIDHQLCDHEVHQNDENGRNNHRLRCGATYAACTTGCRKPVEAPDRRNDEGREQRVGESFHNIAMRQLHVCGV